MRGYIVKEGEYSVTILMVKIVMIFSVPLVLVFFIAYLFEMKTIKLLPISFILSWVGFILLYKKTMKEYKEGKFKK